LNQDELVQYWKQEEKQPFTGWDFSYLDGRMLEEQPPWSYMDLATGLMGESSSVLDMGTGGGEKLLELRPHWPEKVVVTEDYIPNVKLARERLEPLGVRVEHVSLTKDGPMPFNDGEFDLLLNRHSGLNSEEVARILASQGVFLTQQIHALWAHDLASVFGVQPQFEDATPEYYVPLLESVGLSIERVEDWVGSLAFTDVGAIVYYLIAIPWEVPGFTVDTHLDGLLTLQSQLETSGELVFEARKYLIQACKVV
jgi:SAM-dependent methyltransferase